MRLVLCQLANAWVEALELRADVRVEKLSRLNRLAEDSKELMLIVIGFDNYFKRIIDFCIVSFAFVTSIPAIDIHIFSTVLSLSLSVSPPHKCYTHYS